jgi:acyl-CoA synthetase (AMP-forming)/AMP-acid ligase II
MNDGSIRCTTVAIVSSLGDLLAAAMAPDDVAVHVSGRATTRAELEVQIETLAAELVAAGVQPGHVVAVSLPNSEALIAALFAVWRAGAVYLPVNPRLTDTERTRVFQAARPAATISESGVVLVDGRGPRHDDDIALVQLTSGTTGRPKPVLLRHSGVLELLDGVIDSLGSRAARDPSRPPMPNLVPVSLSLWAGIYQVLFAFRVGAPVVVLPQFDTTGFAAAVRTFGIRSTVLPPAAMTMLADDTSITDLNPLRYVRSITAPLSPLQARRFRDRFGIAVLNGYGQTEIGGEIVGWSAADSREHGEAKLGSVGRPHAGVFVRAVDSAGHDLPVDQPGELWVRTPALSAGYADGTDLGDRLSADGWFRTGDIGRVDADGFVWIEGRVSDVINRGGLKVFPAEVAEVLLLAASVADAAVVGAPDDRLGELPVAFVVPAGPDHAVDAVELEHLCRQHLAPYKVPVRFEVVDALPRNEIGKVLHAALVMQATTQGG